jgi:cation transport ATPase
MELCAEGASFVDESMVTGEPMPVERVVGEYRVISGTLNTSGCLHISGDKGWIRNAMLAHIITMVQDAQGSRAPIQATADKISAVFVPVVLVIAVVLMYCVAGAWF